MPPEAFEEFIAELKRRLFPILREYPEIAAAYLFGSVARRTEGPASDLDLGLLLEQGEPAEDERHRFLGDLAARLEILGEVGRAKQPIDLVILNGQGPIFCHEVLREGLLVYESQPERRLDFESETIVRALDFRPTFELATRGYIPAFRRWLRNYRERERRPAAA